MEIVQIQEFLDRYKKRIALDFVYSKNEDLLYFLTYDLFSTIEIYEKTYHSLTAEEKKQKIAGILFYERVLNQFVRVVSSNSKEKELINDLVMDLKNIICLIKEL